MKKQVNDQNKNKKNKYITFKNHIEYSRKVALIAVLINQQELVIMMHTHPCSETEMSVMIRDPDCLMSNHLSSEDCLNISLLGDSVLISGAVTTFITNIH